MGPCAKPSAHMVSMARHLAVAGTSLQPKQERQQMAEIETPRPAQVEPTPRPTQVEAVERPPVTEPVERPPVTEPVAPTDGGKPFAWYIVAIVAIAAIAVIAFHIAG